MGSVDVASMDAEWIRNEPSSNDQTPLLTEQTAENTGNTLSTLFQGSFNHLSRGFQPPFKHPETTRRREERGRFSGDGIITWGCGGACGQNRPPSRQATRTATQETARQTSHARPVSEQSSENSEPTLATPPATTRRTSHTPPSREACLSPGVDRSPLQLHHADTFRAEHHLCASSSLSSDMPPGPEGCHFNCF